LVKIIKNHKKKPFYPRQRPFLSTALSTAKAVFIHGKRRFIHGKIKKIITFAATPRIKKELIISGGRKADDHLDNTENHECAFCGEDSDGVGIFIPDDPKKYGVAARARAFLYFACIECEKTPGLVAATLERQFATVH
jgi:hypothetical protein